MKSTRIFDGLVIEQNSRVIFLRLIVLRILWLVGSLKFLKIIHGEGSEEGGE
jgi:hypothetical protein